jgi:hypothetical protein
MRVEVTFERFAQRGDLLAHLAAREVREHLPVGRAAHQRVEHVAARLAHDVRRDAVELDAGVLERLVQAVDLAGAFLDLRFGIAREVAQLADRLGLALSPAGFGPPTGVTLGTPRRTGDGRARLSGRVLDAPRHSSRDHPGPP